MNGIPASTAPGTLSIVIPFHNSEANCDEILKLIKECQEPDIEFVCIDDGSTDSTPEILSQAKQQTHGNMKLEIQDNRGPGGARNTGLRLSTNPYVWFVDSDDAIDLAIMDTLRTNLSTDFDFIDFNYTQSGQTRNSMGLERGAYIADGFSVADLLSLDGESRFGRLWTKIFNRQFLLKTGFSYPEYCLFEDNHVTYVLPFAVRSFFKSDEVAYDYKIQSGSVTQGGAGARYLDRLFTAESGFRAGLSLATSREEQDSLRSRFDRHYLWTTLGAYVNRRPGRETVTAARIMRQYRSALRSVSMDAKLPDATRRPLKVRLAYRAIWILSHLLPRQDEFFRAQRFVGWRRDYEPPEPLLALD